MKTPAILSFVVLLAQSTFALAADRLVPSQYSTISAAVSAAQNGDRVLVAPGTYNEQVVVSGKAIRIESVAGPSTTTIDRNSSSGAVFSFSAVPAAGCDLVGFTVKRAFDDAVSVSGSTVRISNFRVLSGYRAVAVTGSTSNVTIDGLQSAGMTNSNGTGIRADAGTVLCRTSSMIGASNISQGGAVYVTGSASVRLENCTLSSLSGSYGALYVNSGSLTMIGGSIRDSNFVYGGAAYCSGSGVLSLGQVEFSGLAASYGGVLYHDTGSSTVTSCEAEGVSAGLGGAFVYQNSGQVACTGVVVRQSIVTMSGGVTGGLVRVGDGTCIFGNCEFSDLVIKDSSYLVLRGGIIGTESVGSPIVFNHCQFAGPSFQGNGNGIQVSGALAFASSSRIVRFVNCTCSSFGSLSGSSVSAPSAFALTGSARMEFVDGAFGNSPSYMNASLINAQETSSVSCEGTEFANCSRGVIRASGTNTLTLKRARFIQNKRLLNDSTSGSCITSWSQAVVSIEDSKFLRNDSRALVTSIPGFFMLGNNYFCGSQGSEIYGGIFELAPNYFNLGCEGDCDADGTPDSIVLAKGLDTDCNANGVPDSCDADSGSDCNNNGTPDACDLADGTAADCNLNAVPDSCEADCDADGTPDACEIVSGASDCDTNGVPDSCQADCDSDGVIDICEIAAGATDCDADGTPDDCEIATVPTLDFNNDGTLDSCQPAMQFAGLQLEIQPIVGRGTDDLFPAGAVCYRLYARVTTDGASALGIYGNSQFPMVLNATGGFWQSPFGGDLSVDVACNDTAALPSYRFDSWFTVGKECALGNAVQNTGLDLAAFNAGGGVNDADGIVFVAPGSPQANGGAARRVLLAQLTTTRPVFPTGTVNVVGRSNGGSGPENAWLALGQQIPMPALVDCNGNGEHDAFDIAKGVALDCDQSGVPDTCEHPSAVTDCNGNGISDLCDCFSGFSSDINTNNVPDECECTGDIDANGVVDVDDIIWVLVSWGADGTSEADVNSDGIVNGADLAIVLQGWGQCS